MDEEMWYEYKDLKNGQVCGIGFEKCDEDNRILWNVCFAIGNSKKQVRGYITGKDTYNLTLQSTGRCGLDGLIWAKDKILEFETLIVPNKLKKNKIIIGGENSKRFHVYEKGLKRFGYIKENVYPFGWYMVKNIT